MKNNRIRKLCVCGMFSALIFVVTAFVSIPAGVYGNVNLGDAFIIIATFILGPYGAICGGLGAMIADLIGAYSVYAPGTLIIKILLSLVCFYAYKGIKKVTRLDFISKLIGGILGEAVMVLGYFLYECMLYDVTVAIVSIPFNLIQGGVAVVFGSLISYFLFRSKSISKFLNNLK